jgi:hypothetical protein
MFIIWWGQRIGERTVEETTFLCPRCGVRQPCKRVAVEQQTTLYSFRIGGQQIGEYFECQVCCYSTRSEGAAWSAAAGSPEDHWECPHCHNQNPNDRFGCVKCGQSLV